MSLECSECERDLRGGHDIACSRYNLITGVAEEMMRAVGILCDRPAAKDHDTMLWFGAAGLTYGDFRRAKYELAHLSPNWPNPVVDGGKT